MNLTRIFVKIFALFTVVRGYNLAVLVLAEYLAAIFIFSKKTPKETLLNLDLNLIIFASSFSAAAGYIINNFYDLEKDKISKPIEHYVNRFIPSNFKLITYLVLNAIGILLAFCVSYRVAIFFLVYQFLVWFYSHKVNKILILNNLLSVILKVFPFFALLIYYNNYVNVIFFHAGFLITLLLATDILKDLSSKTVDIIYNYKTLPIALGDKNTKLILAVISLFAIIFAYFLVEYFSIGFMRFYFYFSMISLVIMNLILWNTNKLSSYKMLHLCLKALILFGVISIAFIEINPLALQNIILER